MTAALLRRFAKLPTPGTLAAVAVLMGGLYGADTWLAALETREVNAEARSLYGTGEQMLQTGRPGDAVDRFRRARYLDRGNRAYELAFADALLASGRTDEAKATLGEVLDQDSNDSRANLLMARALAAARQWNDADSYYHRAIYGDWHGNAEGERNKARVELAELLAKQGKKQELLSEVLLLANDAQTGAPSASDLRKKVAAFYLEAGSAARAADAYRALIREHPQDGEAYLGLGQAELQQGLFRSAQGAFNGAARFLTDNAQARQQVQIAENLVELDPTSRRLSSAEKFRRSQRILSLTEDSAMDCFGRKAMPEGLQELLRSAEALNTQKVPAAPPNELAEQRLAVAAEIWKARAEACGPAAPNNVLTVIHRRLDQ